MKARTQRIAATLGVALLALGCDIDIDITDTGADSAEDGVNDDGMEEEGGSEEGTGEGGSEVTDGGEEGPGDTGGEEEEGGSEVSEGGEESEGGEDSGGLGDDCHPLLQNCADGEACYPVDDGALCAPIAEPAQAGDVCEFINACDIGLACVTADAVDGCVGGAGCCAPLCDVASGLCDDPEAVCTPYWEEGTAPPALEDVGLCL